MKPTSIYYERIFPIALYVNEKIGIEATIDPGESMEEALDKAKSQVEEWHRKYEVQINPEFAHLLQPSPPVGISVPVIQAKEENEPEWCLVSDIRKCKELKVLESYKLIVKGKPELQQAYDEMYLKLSK